MSDIFNTPVRLGIALGTTALVSLAAGFGIGRWTKKDAGKKGKKKSK